MARFPNLDGSLVAVHFGHKKIHEYHIVFSLFHHFNSLFTIFSNIDFVSDILENRLGHFLIYKVVLSKQNRKFSRQGIQHGFEVFQIDNSGE